MIKKSPQTFLTSAISGKILLGLSLSLGLIVAAVSFGFAISPRTVPTAGHLGQSVPQRLPIKAPTRNPRYDLALEKMSLDKDGSLILTIKNKGNTPIPDDLFSRILVRITVDKNEHLYFLGPVLGGQSGQILDPRRTLKNPGARLEARTGLTITAPSSVRAEIDAQRALPEIDENNNQLSSTLTPEGSKVNPSVPTVYGSAKKATIVKSASAKFKETLSKTQTATTDQPADSQPASKSPDLTIDAVDLTKPFPPAFRVRIKNIGPGDFLWSVFVKVLWQVAPQGQWEPVGGGTASSIMAGASTDLDILIDPEAIRSLLESGQIQPAAQQKTKVVLTPADQAASASEPKDNNEQAFEFFWDPPVFELWAVNIGHKQVDAPSFIQPDQEGGWLAAGSTAANGMSDLWLVRGDRSGRVLWQKSIDSADGSSAEIAALANLDDGTYLVVGRPVLQNKMSSLVLRVDSNGQILWQETFSADKNCSLGAPVKCPDGSLWLVGQTDSSGAGGHDLLITKIDADGRLIWQKTYGTAADEYPAGAALTADKTVLVFGIRYLRAENETQDMAFGLDLSGNVIWARTFKASGSSGAPSRFRLEAVSADGDLLASGTIAEKGSVRDFVARFGPGGQVKWAQSFSWLPPALFKADPQGGFWVGTSSPANTGEILVLRLRDDGTPDWGRWYGVSTSSSHTSFPVDLMRTGDGGVLALARSDLFAIPDKVGDSMVSWPDMLVMKVDNQGQGSLKLWDWSAASQYKGPISLIVERLELDILIHDAQLGCSSSIKLEVKDTNAVVTSWGKLRFSW